MPQLNPGPARSRPTDWSTTQIRGSDYPGQVVGFARRRHPGLGDWDFAEAARRLDQMPDEAFTPLWPRPSDVAALRERFADCPRT